MNRDEAWTRVRSARVGRMGTVTADRRPHVVPFVFVLVESGSGHVVYWAVDHKPKRSTDLKRIRNIRHDPAVELVVDGYEEDWDRLWWVRCSGTARMVEAEPERGAAVRALAEKYPQYRLAPPDGPVVAIDVGAIEWWEGATRRRPT